MCSTSSSRSPPRKGVRWRSWRWPGWPSALASAWSARGGAVVPGLEMLLYQAVEQVLLFTGNGPEKAPRVIDAMCDAVNAPRRG